MKGPRLPLFVAILWLRLCSCLAETDGNDDFDYIIVGGGNAGSVLARRLSDRPDLQVLLLEAGSIAPKDDPIWMKKVLPRFTSSLWESPWMTRRFFTQPNPSLFNRPVEILIGATFGGTTSINGGLYSKSFPYHFDEWNVPGWRGNDTTPYFKKVENYPGSSDIYGHDGLLHIEESQRQETANDFLKAFGQLNPPIPVIEDGMDAQEGMFVIKRALKKGRRQDAFTAYVEPVLNRTNLHVRPGSKAVKIMLDGNRATGVSYLYNGQLIHATATKEVILCAGTFGTPQLLMLSGIGNRTELESHNITVKAEVPAVGENLIMRPIITLVYNGSRVVDAMNPDILNSTAAIEQWNTTGMGPLSSGVAGVYGHIRTDPSLERPDVIFYASDSPPMFKAPSTGYITFCLPTHPQSKGRISLYSKDPQQPPMVYSNMLELDSEVESLVRCVKMSRNLQRTDALKGNFHNEIVPGEAVQSDEDLRNFIRAGADFSYHAFCSCRMGTDEEVAAGKAVVNPQLLVKGFVNLRVVDGSILPDPVPQGPMSLIYMFGEKAADMILNSPAPVDEDDGSSREIIIVLVTVPGVLIVAFFVRWMWQTTIRKKVRAKQQAWVKRVKRTIWKEEQKRRSTLLGENNSFDSFSSMESIAAKAVEVAMSDDPSSYALLAEDDAEEHAETRAASKRQDLLSGAMSKAFLKRSKVLRDMGVRLNNPDSWSKGPSYIRHLYADARPSPVSVEFEDLGYFPETTDVNQVPEPIVQNATGEFKAGTFVALMGSSGCGKTTLLDLICNRKQDGLVVGEIRLDGQEASKSRTFYRDVSYMQGDDLLIPNLTVRENVRFYADLRLPNCIPRRDKHEIAEVILESLGLDHVADSQVGGDIRGYRLRGVSSGERRRAMVACCMVTKPRLLVLDEPTSGLDAASALVLMTRLSNTAKFGLTIACSIHQPSKEILQLFDSLFLMAKGCIVYQGPPAVAVDFFSTMVHYDPAISMADYMLACISNCDTRELAVEMRQKFEKFMATDAFVEACARNERDKFAPLLNIFRHILANLPSSLSAAVQNIVSPRTSLNGTLIDPPEREIAALIDGFLQHFCADSAHSDLSELLVIIQPSMFLTLLRAAASPELPHSTAIAKPVSSSRSRTASIVRPVSPSDTDIHLNTDVNWFQRFWVLLERNFKIYIRTVDRSLTRFAMTVCAIILIGLFYQHLPDGQSGVQNRLGAIYYLCLQAFMIPFGTCALFQENRMYYHKERPYRMYGASEYYISVLIGELVNAVICIIPAIAGVYWILRLTPDVARFFTTGFVLLLIHFAGNSYAAMSAYATPNPDIAFLVAGAYLCLCQLCSGFFVRFSIMPGYLRWMRWLSVLSYAFEALMIGEFRGRPLECNFDFEGLCVFDEGSEVIEYFQFNPANLHLDIIAIVAFIILCHVFGSIFMKTAQRLKQ
eukprot:GILJ01010466.1.p1 GENE.GILJ01010466.1~~GILJ01010466.1.p1  ORF type:complete len:1432 (+),score=255.99 GILJ01010466.1:44-4339(+)